MLRNTLIAFSFLTSASAMAAGFQCSISLNDDIIITPQTVQVVGASGDMSITPDGGVTRNGKTLTLTDEQKQKAIRYQSLVRADMPWIKQETEKKLSSSRQTMDKVVIQVIGQDSNVRNRLVKLEKDINNQLGQVIESGNGSLAFRHQAVKQVETNGRKLVNDSLGGMLQDSINEMSRKQLLSGGNSQQGLQGLLGNLGGLQTELEAEWKKQELSFQIFGQQVCAKIGNAEQQRIGLINSIK
nr:DUF2884 family protein [uncultured Moellerella sp.]